MVQVGLEDGAGGRVGGLQHQGRVEGDHAGGEAREHRAEITAFVLHLLTALARRFAGFRQALGHLVEGGHQEAHFVPRGSGRRVVKSPRATARVPSTSVLDRRHQGAGRHERTPHGHQHATRAAPGAT